MIKMEKSGAELADKLAELDRLRKSKAVETAELMAAVTDALDTELAVYRRREREGERLMEQGITLDRLREIYRAFGGRRDGGA